MRVPAVLCACVAALSVAACGGSGKPPRSYAAVDAARMAAVDEHAGEWMSHGRDYEEQRFSPLTQINVANVSRLGLAWYADFDTRRAQEATPIVVDGVIYVTTAWSKVRAFDAKTGKELWSYDPKVPGESGVNTCCDVVNRGVAAWNGKIYLGTIDGRLVALDGGTGKVVWEVQTTDRTKPYTITGAPRIGGGKIFIGQAGSEFHTRGYVSAYDAETGRLDWRWFVVPGNPAEGFETPQMELAAKTWGGEWWKTGGGGAPWDAITYDRVTNLVYVGTGNGGPFPAEVRSPGNNVNLYINSIVALRPDTGEYVWHYQMTPHDSWDYDGTQQLTVAELQLDGESRRVVMQASKNGFFYVVDARDGHLLSAKPFIEGINWATGVDLKTGAPQINPRARYDKTNEGFIVVPSLEGAHSWHPMSFNPQTGLVYIPAIRSTFPVVVNREPETGIGQKVAVNFAKGFELYARPGAIRFSDGFLVAWDPIRQREAWHVKFEDSRGGGTLSTAGGLVFQGNSKNQEFVAYRADNGQRLWSMPVQTGIVAGAATYMVEGEQYVAVVAGARALGDGNYYSPNYSRLLVFKRGGTASLPPKSPEPLQILNPPAPIGTADEIARGGESYNRYCGTCHGINGQSRGMFPDLKYSGALHSAAALKAIVLDGALSKNGMASFSTSLNEGDVEGIRSYLIAQTILAFESVPVTSNPQKAAAKTTPAQAPH